MSGIAGGGASASSPNPFAYDFWPTSEPQQWAPAERGESSWDNLDFHVDLGCGRLRKGRIGVDRYPSEAADVLADLDHGVWTFAARSHPPAEGFGTPEYGGAATLDRLNVLPPDRTPSTPPIAPEFRNPDGTHPEVILGLPFGDSSIESIISHHAFEHVAEFIALMDECYRVLVPGGILRIVTPLFPSKSAVEDPDHRQWIMEETFASFCGTPGETPQNCWLASFSVPYTNSRFEMRDKDMTPVEGDVWQEAREIRVAMEAMK